MIFNTSLPLTQRTLCLQRLSKPTPKPISHHSSRRSSLVVRAQDTQWDPEGLFKTSAPKTGIIDRRMMQKRIETDQEFKKQMEEFAAKKREELVAKRESRLIPTDNNALIEYFLDTETPEMEFEVARCRTQLDTAFFSNLDTSIGSLRFAAVPNEDRLAELETLRDYLKEAVEAVDKAAQSVSAPADRLKKLLESKDKKAMLLEMAGENEIDQGLIGLLEQNISGAEAAGQKEAAEFMGKILLACRRYVIS